VSWGLTRAERDMQRVQCLGLVCVCGTTRGQRGTVLTVGGVMGTARYLHTARILKFGGRFDSEGVGLARIHIPQLSAWIVW
jgi:hypothetical protein